MRGQRIWVACVFISPHIYHIIRRRFNRDLITQSGRIKTTCCFCRQKKRDNTPSTRALISAETLLHPPVPPRAPPTTPREQSTESLNPDTRDVEDQECDLGVEHFDYSGDNDLQDSWEDDIDQYSKDELNLFHRIGVSSYRDITEEVLASAPTDCVRILRNTLRLAHRDDPTITTFSGLMPKSESRWEEPKVKVSKTVGGNRSIYAGSGDTFNTHIPFCFALGLRRRM